MTPLEVLALAKAAMTAGRFKITIHTEYERGPQRGARYHDIKTAVLSASSAARQPNGTWRLLGGHDLDGDSLIVVIAIDAQSIKIVSIFE